MPDSSTWCCCGGEHACLQHLGTCASGPPAATVRSISTCQREAAYVLGAPWRCIWRRQSFDVRDSHYVEPNTTICPAPRAEGVRANPLQCPRGTQCGQDGVWRLHP